MLLIIILLVIAYYLGKWVEWKQIQWYYGQFPAMPTHNSNPDAPIVDDDYIY